jgi:hypothetical protein
MMLNGMQTKEYPTSYSIAELTNTHLRFTPPCLLACLLGAACSAGARLPYLTSLYPSYPTIDTLLLSES